MIKPVKKCIKCGAARYEQFGKCERHNCGGRVFILEGETNIKLKINGEENENNGI